jgi:hypothetical protein
VLRLAASAGQRWLKEEDNDWRSLGLEYEEVFEHVARLEPRDFDKSIASDLKPGTWLDVYRPLIHTRVFPNGVRVYCKVTITAGGALLIVLSFKEA